MYFEYGPFLKLVFRLLFFSHWGKLLTTLSEMNISSFTKFWSIFQTKTAVLTIYSHTFHLWKNHKSFQLPAVQLSIFASKLFSMPKIFIYFAIRFYKQVFGNHTVVSWWILCSIGNLFSLKSCNYILSASFSFLMW